MRQPAGRLTAPLPSGNRVGVSGGTDPDPEAGLADRAAGVDGLGQASVSARSSIGSVSAKRLASSKSTAAAGLVPAATETMASPAILLLPCVFALTVKKA